MSKVLIVNSHITWGGLGQFTLSLVKGLSAHGYEVNGLITHSDSHNFNAFKQLTHSTLYVGRLPKIIKYFKIFYFIYTMRPDVIIINYNAVIHFLLPFIPKCMVISVIHSEASEFYRISKINYPHVNAWVAPTPGVKDGFIHYCDFPRAKSDTIVIPHGIAESKNSRKTTAPDELILAFVGAVYEHKGADLLPEIFEKVLAAIPYARLKIIGTGEMETDLKNIFEQKGMISHVEFMGVIPHDQVRETLSQSDILLFPTRVEAFGLVIAEAMMEGTVPVVTLLPGITDATVTDSETGFLILKDDVESFAQKVIELGNDPELLSQMSQASMNSAKERLSLSTMSRHYDELIKGHS